MNIATKIMPNAIPAIAPGATVWLGRACGTLKGSELWFEIGFDVDVSTVGVVVKDEIVDCSDVVVPVELLHHSSSFWTAAARLGELGQLL